MDFAFDIAGKKAPVLGVVPTRGGNFTFNDSFVYLAPYYLADNATTVNEMPVGFPQLITADSKNTFTIRFDKADKTLKWDALLIIRRKDVAPAPVPPTPTPTPVNPQNVTVGNYSVDILGRSGKININYIKESRLTFEFSKLAEVFTNGTEIEKKAVNHTFDNFANLDFEVSNFTAGQFQNLSCISTNIKLKSFFRKTALDASFYIFNQSGLIKTGVQVINGTNVDVFENVTVGSVKMSLGVQNWTFCNNLGDANDEAVCNFGIDTKNIKTELELEVIIKSKSEGKPDFTKKGKSNLFKFGDSSASFSPYYTADGANLAMPDSYPTLNNTGNKNTFRFRFANFKSAVMWDPIFQAQVESNPTPVPPTPSPAKDDELIKDTEVILESAGGKMNFKAFGDKNSTVSDFKIQFLSIKEVDGNGNLVAKKTGDHSVTSFANVIFTVKTSNVTVYPNSKLNVTLMQMESTALLGGAKLSANVYVFSDDGTLTVGDKKYEVKDGDVKFDVAVQKWKFCAVKFNNTDNTTSGNCPGDSNTFENGAFLDLEFAVNASAKSSQNGEGRFVYGTSSFIVPNVYGLDNKMSTMPTGYPKYTQGQTQDSYVLRFAPFQNEVNYDPIVSFPIKAGGSGSALIIVIVILALLLLAVAIVIYCKNRSNRKHSDAIEKGNRFVDV